VAGANDKGGLLGVAAEGDKELPSPESMMHIELDQVTAADAVAALQRGLEGRARGGPGWRSAIGKAVCNAGARDVIAELETKAA